MTYIAEHYPCSDPSPVLTAPVNTNDGRSEWRWFRLANGDLILGVFPQGDAYEGVETLVERDYLAAKASQSHQIVED